MPELWLRMSHAYACCTAAPCIPEFCTTACHPLLRGSSASSPAWSVTPAVANSCSSCCALPAESSGIRASSWAVRGCGCTSTTLVCSPCATHTCTCTNHVAQTCVAHSMPCGTQRLKLYLGRAFGWCLSTFSEDVSGLCCHCWCQGAAAASPVAIRWVAAQPRQAAFQAWLQHADNLQHTRQVYLGVPYLDSLLHPGCCVRITCHVHKHHRRLRPLPGRPPSRLLLLLLLLLADAVRVQESGVQCGG